MSNIGPKKLPTIRDSKNPEELDVFQREVREAFRQVARDTADSITNITNIISTGTGLVNSVTGIAPIDATPTTGDVVVSIDTSGFLGGSGTTNQVAKWTPDSTHLGDSSITDTGTLVTVANPTVILAPDETQEHLNVSGANVSQMTADLVLESITTDGATLNTNGTTRESVGLLVENGTVRNAGFLEPTGTLNNYGVKTIVDGANGGNVAFYAEASGGATNYSFYGEAGDLYNNGNGSFTGNVTLGDSNADSHTANGIFNVQQLRGKVQTYTGAGGIQTITINPDTTLLRLEPTSILDLVGFTGGGAGRIVLVQNTGSNHALLYPDNVNCINPADRIQMDSEGTGRYLFSGTTTGTVGLLIYNEVTQRWWFAPIAGKNLGGATTIYGNFSTTGSGTITGAASLGSNIANAHALLGTLSLNGTAGTNGQIAYIDGANGPKWGAPSVAGINTFSTNNVIPKGDGSNLVASTWTDDGTVTTTSASSLRMSRAAASQVELQWRQSGQRVWAMYEPASSDQLRIWNDSTGDSMVFDGAGNATFAFQVAVNSSMQVLGNATLGDAAGDAHTVNGTLTCVNDVLVNGNATLGNASTDTHTLNGNITLNNPPAAGPIKYGALQGRLYIKRQVFTASGTYTPSTDAKACMIHVVGCGGGGGGAQGGGAGNCAAGSGGASGAYIKHWIEPGVNLTGGAVTIGTAGAGGASTGGTGGTGGNCSVVVQGVTYTAIGGAGGVGQTTGTSLTAIGATAAPTGSTSTDFTVCEGGTSAFRLSGTSVLAGVGGSNPLGGGGLTVTPNVAGVAGNGYGSGGGGAVATTTNSTGGAGKAGVVIIEEYA